jgi:CHAD domain-containing protein
VNSLPDPSTPLQPGMPTDYAVALLLWRELQTLEENEHIVVNERDDEALHSFRISVRKTRALLNQCKAVFGKKHTKSLQESFKWIGAFTTPVRDLDVLIIKLNDYGQCLPEEYKYNLEVIHDYLQTQRDRAYHQLQHDLNGPRYRRFIKDWHHFLSDILCGKQQGDIRKPIIQFANRKTWNTYQLVLAEGRAITDESPAEALHELRKTCKKLRYLIDFFSDLHPADEVRKLIRILKKLQNFLGDFQDAEAHLDLLLRFRQMGSQDARTRVSFMLTSDLLIQELHKRESDQRYHFNAVFKRFDRPKTHALLMQLYGT